MSNEVKRIIGNTVGIPSPHTDFSETNPAKGSYLKNRESLIQLIKNSGGGSGGATPSIIDLGTFAYEFDGDTGETIEDQTQEYGDAIDSAIETGMYKISWTEQGIVDTSVIIVMKCKDNLKNDYVLQIKFTPSMFHEVLSSIDDDPNWYGVIYTRAYCRNKWTPWQEPFERSFYKTNDMDNPNEQTYPTTKAVSNFVNDKIVTNYGEWFENARDDTDFDKKVPAMRVIYDFFEYSQYLTESNIIDNISSDADDFIYTDIPNAEAVKSYIDAQMNRAPEQELPAVLEPNKEYNLGVITDAVILFPEEANDGDVIYVVFTAGTPTDNVLIAINIDSNSGLSEFEPEPGKKYEIYGRYDSKGAVWLCGYAEY